MNPLLLWIPLLVLSAPVILDWGSHALSHPWAAYSLFFPLATWQSARSLPSPERTHRSPPAAFALILVGMMIQLWAIASVSVRHGRPGLLLCVAGMLILQGRAHWRVLIPLLLCVPIPSLILKRLGMVLAPGLAELYASVARLLDIPAFASGRLLELPHGHFYLDYTDMGMSAGLLGFGLGWIACQTRELRLGPSLVRSGLAGLSGMLVQLVATGLLLATSAPEQFPADRALRDYSVYAVLSACCLGFGIVTRRRRSELEASA